MDKNKLLKSFIHFVSLNILGMIGLSCYILADTYFISKGLGPNGLASLNLAISIYSFINAVGLMIGIGAATKFTILKAEKKYNEANVIFTHGIILGIFIDICFIFLGVFASSKISHLLGANKNTLEMTNIYLKTILSFSPFYILNSTLIAFVRNDLNPKLSMVAMLTGSIINIILDYIFIFSLKMGMFGAAFATGIAPIISLLVLSSHILKKNNSFHLTKCKIEFSKIKNIYSLGSASFIVEMSSGLVLIVFNLIILKISGNIGVAAYGIVANLGLVALAIFTGIAQGIQPIASKSYGMKKLYELKSILKYSIITCFSMAIFIYIITFVFSDGLVQIFNSEGNLMLKNFAKEGLRIYFIGFIFAGINVVLSAFFSSTEKALEGFVISIIRGALAIVPLVLIFSFAFGMKGVWLSFPISEAITIIVAAFFLKKTKINLFV